MLRISNNSYATHSFASNPQEDSEAASSSFTSSKVESISAHSDHINLSQMPPEMIQKIINNLDVRNLRALSCTSKAFSKIVPSFKSGQVRRDLNAFVNNQLSVSEEIKQQFIDIQKNVQVPFRNLPSLDEHIKSVKEKIRPILSYLTKEQLKQLKAISPLSSLGKPNILNIAIAWEEIPESGLKKSIIALADEGDCAEVLKMARLFSDHSSRSPALKEVVDVLIATKDLELILEAKELAKTIRDDSIRSSALWVIVEALVATEKPKLILKAKKLAQTIPDELQRSFALAEAVQTLIATKKPELILMAIELAQMIPLAFEHSIALTNVVKALVATEQPELVLKAQELILEAQALAQEIPSDFYNSRSRALVKVVEALIAFKDPKFILEANTLVQTMPNDNYRDDYYHSEAVGEIVKGLVDTKNHALVLKAKELALTITGYHHSQALNLVETALNQL